jgi:hypothetical protein
MSKYQWLRRRTRESAAASLLGLRVRIPTGHGCLSLVIVGCCQVHDSESGLSLIQTSAAECGVYNDCDREAPCREAMNRNRVQALQNKMNDLSDKYVGISD